MISVKNLKDSLLFQNKLMRDMLTQLAESIFTLCSVQVVSELTVSKSYRKYGTLQSHGDF